jgi:glycosyltransferase involved in cell wall biosynthesis
MPAYNEAAVIADVARGARAHGEVLVVDDGSSDGTGDAAKSGGADVLRLDPNCGYEGALDAGLREAVRRGADVVVTYDSDGQFEAGSIEAVLAPFRGGDITLVLGIRPKMARWSEALFGLYTQLRFDVSDILCGVKAYDRNLLQRYGYLNSGRSVGTEIALRALRAGEPFATVKTAPLPRADGISRFGAGLRAETKILEALLLALGQDIRSASTSV